MRIRQVKPGFFKDARMAELSPEERLFYIGLWMLADDAGYLRWDPAEAALELYGYDPRDQRERAVTDHLAVLIAAGRVTNLECGHLFVPTFTTHQRLAGPTSRVLTYEREHLKCYAPRIPAGVRDDPTSPDPVRSGTGNGAGTGRFVSEPVSAPAPAPGDADARSLKEKVGWQPGTSVVAELGPICNRTPSCGKPMTGHRPGTDRWVCTNAPAHAPATRAGQMVAAGS